MGKEVRVGLVGYGFAGRTFHAPVITSIPNLKLAKVVERKSELSKQRYPWVEVVKSVQEIYSDESIDVVVITTPSTNHYDFVKEALLAGKHVVVEKPFTTTTAEADELISIAKQQGKVLSVFHNRRWDGDFLTISKLLEDHKLGKLVEAEFRWDTINPKVNSERWRDKETLGSGIFYDLGVHFLDQALCLFGMPKTITGDIRIQREGGLTDDYFDVSLGYEDGLKVSVRATKLAHEPRPRYVFRGTTGSFVKYGNDPQEAALKSGLTPQTPNWGMEPKEYWGTLHITRDNLKDSEQVQTIPGSYQSYYQNIYDHITENVELAVKAEEARAAIRLIELGLQSSKEQRTIEVTE